MVGRLSTMDTRVSPEIRDGSSQPMSTDQRVYRHPNRILEDELPLLHPLALAVVT